MCVSRGQCRRCCPRRRRGGEPRGGDGQRRGSGAATGHFAVQEATARSGERLCMAVGEAVGYAAGKAQGTRRGKVGWVGWGGVQVVPRARQPRGGVGRLAVWRCTSLPFSALPRHSRCLQPAPEAKEAVCSRVGSAGQQKGAAAACQQQACSDPTKQPPGPDLAVAQWRCTPFPGRMLLSLPPVHTLCAGQVYYIHSRHSSPRLALAAAYIPHTPGLGPPLLHYTTHHAQHLTPTRHPSSTSTLCISFPHPLHHVLPSRL